MIGAHASICLSESDKEAQLVEWILARLPERCKDQYTIVFDGNSALHAAGRHAKQGPIRIRYTYGDETADDVIIKMVETGAKKVTVVSDDNDIKYHIKKKRVLMQSVAQFISILNQGFGSNPDAKPQEEMNDYAISQWLDAFGQTD